MHCMICSWPNSPSVSSHPACLPNPPLVDSTAQPLPGVEHFSDTSTASPRKPVLSWGLWAIFQQCSKVFNKSLQNAAPWTHSLNSPHLRQLQPSGTGPSRIFNPYYMYLEMRDSGNPRSSRKSVAGQEIKLRPSHVPTKQPFPNPSSQEPFSPVARYQLILVLVHAVGPGRGGPTGGHRCPALSLL